MRAARDLNSGDFAAAANNAARVRAVRACNGFFSVRRLAAILFDGNKRTSRFMMNGVLMSHGIDAISIPAAKAHEFNEKMVRFYLSKDATEMMDFLIRCHPDAESILQAH